jgi:hypothetical protein
MARSRRRSRRCATADQPDPRLSCTGAPRSRRVSFTQKLDQRPEEHHAGRESPLVAAVIADGIEVSARRPDERSPLKGGVRASAETSGSPTRPVRTIAGNPAEHEIVLPHLSSRPRGPSSRMPAATATGRGPCSPPPAYLVRSTRAKLLLHLAPAGSAWKTRNAALCGAFSEPMPGIEPGTPFITSASFAALLPSVQASQSSQSRSVEVRFAGFGADLGTRFA